MRASNKHQALSRPQTGFSLLEMMIVAALLSILCLAFSSLLTTTSKNVRNTQLYTDLATMSSNVLQLIQNDVLCKQGFINGGAVANVDTHPATFTPPAPVTQLNLGTAVIANLTSPFPAQPPPGIAISKMGFDALVKDLGTIGGYPAALFRFHMEGTQKASPDPGALFQTWSKDFYVTVLSDAVAPHPIRHCYGGLIGGTPASWSCEVKTPPPVTCAAAPCVNTTISTPQCSPGKRIVFASCGPYPFSLNLAGDIATCTTQFPTVPAGSCPPGSFTANLTALCCE